MSNELKTYEIQDGMCLFSFEGKGAFCVHSEALWKAWQQYTKDWIKITYEDLDNSNKDSAKTD